MDEKYFRVNHCSQDYDNDHDVIDQVREYQSIPNQSISFHMSHDSDICCACDVDVQHPISHREL